MSLQPTYYDFIKKKRPVVVELAEHDATGLMAGENPPVTIHSVDDYASRYEECLKYFQRSIEHTTGVNFDSLAHHLGYADMLQMRTLFETITHEYHSVVNFALGSKKTFYFHDNLAEHLANTEINLKTGLIELPFPTCQFIFTAPAVINAMYGIGNHDAYYYSDPVSVFITMHPANTDFPYRKLMMVAFHASISNGSHLFIKRELCMDDSWTLEQALRTDWLQLTPDNHGHGTCINNVDGTSRIANDKDFYTDGLLFFRIVLNAVLYLTSEQAEMTALTSQRAELEARAAATLSAPKRKKILREARKYSSLDCMEVGASIGAIVITHGVDTGNENNGSGGKPSVRFMVRGHWRNQAYGMKNTERKLIWIRPFYKGPDVATHINKPYVVK